MADKVVSLKVLVDTKSGQVNVEELDNDIKKTIKDTETLGQQSKDNSEQMSSGFKKVGDSSGIAGANLMAFNGIISDANYGIRGIANNIQQFAATFAMLVGQTGSVKEAFKSLLGVFKGPLGILTVISIATSLLERFSMQQKKTAEETDDVTSSLAKESVQAQVMFGNLKKLVTENGNLTDVKAAAEEINKKYNTQLDTENVTLQQLASEYERVALGIELKTRAEIASAQATKAMEQLPAKQVEILKLQSELANKEATLSALMNANTEKSRSSAVSVSKDILNTRDELEKLKQEEQALLNQKQIGLHVAIEATNELSELGLRNTKAETDASKKAAEERAKAVQAEAKALINTIEDINASKNWHTTEKGYFLDVLWDEEKYNKTLKEMETIEEKATNLVLVVERSMGDKLGDFATRIEGDVVLARDGLSAITDLYSSFESNNDKRNRKIFENTKKLNIAITVMDTYLAAQKAYTSQLDLDPTSPIRAAIAAGIAVIGGLARVNAIRNTKYGDTSAKSTTTGGGSTSVSGSTSNRVDAELTPITAQSIRRTRKMDTVRVVVVESDIRETTDRIDSIMTKAVVQ